MDSFLASAAARGKAPSSSNPRSERVSSLLQPIVLVPTAAGDPALVNDSAIEEAEGNNLLSAIAAELDEPAEPRPLAWYAPLRPITTRGCALESTILTLFSGKAGSATSVFVPFLASSGSFGSFHAPYTWNIDALDALHLAAQGSECSARPTAPCVASTGFTVSVRPSEDAVVTVSLSIQLDPTRDAAHNAPSSARNSSGDRRRVVTHPPLLVTNEGLPCHPFTASAGSLQSLQLAVGAGYTAAQAAYRAAAENATEDSTTSPSSSCSPAATGVAISITVHAHLVPGGTPAAATPLPVLRAAAAAASLAAASSAGCVASSAEAAVAAAAANSKACEVLEIRGNDSETHGNHWEWIRALLPTVTFPSLPPKAAVGSAIALVSLAAQAAGSVPAFASTRATITVSTGAVTEAAEGGVASANTAVDVTVGDMDWDVFAALSRYFCPLFVAMVSISAASKTVASAEDSHCVSPPCTRLFATPFAAWPGLLLSAAASAAAVAPAAAVGAAAAAKEQDSPEHEEEEESDSTEAGASRACKTVVECAGDREAALATRLSIALLAKVLSTPAPAPASRTALATGLTLPATMGSFVSMLSAGDLAPAPALRARAAVAAAVTAPLWPFLDSPLAIAHAAHVFATTATAAAAAAVATDDAVAADAPLVQLPLAAALDRVSAVAASDAVNDSPYTLPFLSATLRAQPTPALTPAPSVTAATAGLDSSLEANGENKPWSYILAPRLAAPSATASAAGPTLFPSRPAPASAAAAGSDVRLLANPAGVDLSDLSVLMRLASQGAAATATATATTTATAAATAPVPEPAAVAGFGFSDSHTWVSSVPAASDPSATSVARARVLALSQLPASARALLPLLPALPDAVTVGTFVSRGRPASGTAAVVAVDAARERPWWGLERAGVASTVAVVGVKEAVVAACEEAKALLLQV